MDNPEPPRKPRWFVRWFSPLRLRFWIVTLPLVFWSNVFILLFWPGWRYSWTAGDWLRIQRHSLGSGETGMVRIGHFRLVKAVNLASIVPQRGFFSTRPMEAGFGWETGFISINAVP